MADALIGFTGFVGGNLARQARFDDLYNSSNIDAIAGKSYRLIVCAGAAAEKWKINADPARDIDAMKRLTGPLASVRAERVVLISTIDVYPSPEDVDEDSWIDSSAASPYGAHRFELEHFVASRFESLIVRLPGLFGVGLKKNVIFDLLHHHQVAAVHADSAYQFYDVGNLWRDIDTALTHGLPLLNVATEPTTVRQLAREAFGLELTHTPAAAPARYDFRSKHARLFGGCRGYLYDRRQILSAMQRFVAAERRPSE